MDSSVHPHCRVCLSPGVLVMIESLAIQFWQCTRCEHRWHDHTEGTWEHELADPFVQRGKERARGKDSSGLREP